MSTADKSDSKPDTKPDTKPGDQLRAQKAADDRRDDRREDRQHQGDGDYVLTLADGSQERAASNVATEHNGQPVTATRYAPQDSDD